MSIVLVEYWRGCVRRCTSRLYWCPALRRPLRAREREASSLDHISHAGLVGGDATRAQNGRNNRVVRVCPTWCVNHSFGFVFRDVWLLRRDLNPRPGG